MSSVSEIPENFQFPADYKSPPRFNSTVLLDRLYSERISDDNADAKWLAYGVAFNAFVFLTTPQPPSGSDYAALQETPTHIRLTTWVNRRGKLLNYLNPYVAEVRNQGTPEQAQFIHELLDMSLHEYFSAKFQGQLQDTQTNDSDDVDDGQCEAEELPNISEVCATLEQIAQTHSPTSAEYVALQITLRGLRYLIESGEVPEFLRYVEQTSKCDPPSS